MRKDNSLSGCGFSIYTSLLIKSALIHVQLLHLLYKLKLEFQRYGKFIFSSFCLSNPSSVFFHLLYKVSNSKFTLEYKVNESLVKIKSKYRSYIITNHKFGKIKFLIFLFYILVTLNDLNP